MRTVVYVESGLSGGGSFESLRQHLAAVDKKAIKAIAVFLNQTPYVERFRSMDVGVHLVKDPVYSRELHESSPRFARLKERAAILPHILSPRASIAWEALVHGHPVRELARIIESEGAHILHTNNQVNRDLYAVIAAKRAGVPCVAHLRSFFSLGFNKTKARFVNEHVARFVAYSPAVAEHWTALGLDSRKIEVLPNAIGEVPADPLDLHAEYGIPREKKLVGIVGKVIPVRGHDFLFRALRVLGRHDVVLLVVGGGEEREIRRAKSRTVELGIGERVLFTGHSARAKDVIAALDALVMPYGIEPFGRVLLEAWKLGTPVVMSALGGIRDLADHGENALLVSYGDEKALAEAMARILDDESLAERLSANGRKHVQKRFSVAAYANRMQEIYESVLSEAEHGQAS